MIGEDATVRNQEIQQLEGPGNPPPAYGKHISDLMFGTFSSAATSEDPTTTETIFEEVPTCLSGIQPPPCYERLICTDPMINPSGHLGN